MGKRLSLLVEKGWVLLAGITSDRHKKTWGLFLCETTKSPSGEKYRGCGDNIYHQTQQRDPPKNQTRNPAEIRIQKHF